MRNIIEIENRFKEISNLNNIDLTKSLIKKSDYPNQQVKTRKDKSKLHGEVFTPLYLVDAMIWLKFKDLNPNSKTCDLCAGYGQFTIRLMRIMYNKFHNNINEWLKNSHTLTELQMESCAKLVYVFGPNINLYCGDSLKLDKSNENDTGILFFNENTNQWNNNELINILLQNNIVQNNLKILQFIFENNNDNTKLQTLIQRLK